MVLVLLLLLLLFCAATAKINKNKSSIVMVIERHTFDVTIFLVLFTRWRHCCSSWRQPVSRWQNRIRMHIILWNKLHLKCVARAIYVMEPQPLSRTMLYLIHKLLEYCAQTCVLGGLMPVLEPLSQPYVNSETYKIQGRLNLNRFQHILP